ncbi:MAG: phosphoenolpyruvate synthase [Chlamydiae bacterium]|nr:phosphoenolpyruvate synthase [Chlamydiota bacterium]
MKKKQIKDPYILWFDEMTMKDIALVGGKNASLGEMYCHLKKRKIKIPPGFAITSAGYRYLLDYNDVVEKLRALFTNLNASDSVSIARAGAAARKIILSCEIPQDLNRAICKAYQKLSKQCKETSCHVAVRSSATAEDLPEASFAGQHESFLNIRGEKHILTSCLRCFASLFKDRAIAYRQENNIDHFTTSLSIGIQKMVRSDVGSSGVIFTVDTESGFQDLIFITASNGLGENIVQGAVDPDEFYLFKPTLKKKLYPIIHKTLGSKKTKIIYGKSKTQSIKKITTSKREQNSFSITENDAIQLAKWSLDIESHYSKRNGKWTPMDIEFAKDGKTGELFIVQARPETTLSKRPSHMITQYSLTQKGRTLSRGKSVGNKIGQGKARIIENINEMHLFKKGEVLVTEMTNPDWVPIMRIASAIVTNRGGRTSHAAIVSRELGLPCIVGTGDATKVIKTGQNITIDCSKEEEGIVYDGLCKIHKEDIDVQNIPKTKTDIMVNIGHPEDAIAISLLPTKGVGLARLEFIISEHIKIHPMALIYFDKIKNKKVREAISSLTHEYKDKKQYFIDKLASGVGLIAAAFYPRTVIVRFSDFKTNEYSHLIGGESFEPKEENAMIGWRGASRYYKEGYKEGFALECAAIKKVRDEMGLTNVKVMIPVCRTLEEGKKVLSTMKKNSLTQGKNSLEVYVMCEIPSNVILAEEFCSLFDGMSIGSNDLTQMVLGVDRDNDRISDLFNEKNPAVKKFIHHVISVAKKKKCKIGICGEAPSVYPEFAQFLVDCGINSISLSPDAVVKTLIQISDYEKK